MNYARYRCEQIHSLKDREFFIDTNALIYVFFPSKTKKNEEWARIYSKVYRCIREMGIKTFLNIMVLSEIVNKVMRIRYEEFLRIKDFTSKGCSFKDFRDSSDGQENLDFIYSTIKSKVLSNFELCNKEYSDREILDFMSADRMDFVDKGIEALCKERDLILITNDADFTNSDIEILTANNSILKQS